MNYVILADQNSIEEVVETFRGHCNIIAITEEASYVDHVKSITERYIKSENGVSRPISKLSVLSTFLPKLSLVYARGTGYVRDIDEMDQSEQMVPFDDDEYMDRYAYNLMVNPLSKAKMYFLAHQIYNGDKPLVITSTEEENSDLMTLDCMNRIFSEWFRIYPCSLDELERDRSIVSLQPDPKYKSEVNEFVSKYKEMEKGKVNLR